MTAEPAGEVWWSPSPFRQRPADHTVEDILQLPDDAPRVEDPLHIFAYDLVGGRYESAEELVLSKPFEIRLPIRGIAP